MESRFARALTRLHRVGAKRLADSVGDYLDHSGRVIDEQVYLLIDRSVERFSELDGLLERVTTVSVPKTNLSRIDRKGAFRVGDSVLHLDGIESDDGSLITFYVRP